MKTTALAQILFLPIFTLILFQPTLSHIDYSLDVIVKANAEYAVQKAAPYGYLTSDIKQEILDNLADVGFNPDFITIESQLEELERGQRIDIIITAPRMQMYLYKLGSKDIPRQYFAHAYTTSEYIR